MALGQLRRISGPWARMETDTGPPDTAKREQSKPVRPGSQTGQFRVRCMWSPTVKPINRISTRRLEVSRENELRYLVSHNLQALFRIGYQPSTIQYPLS